MENQSFFGGKGGLGIVSLSNIHVLVLSLTYSGYFYQA